MVKQGDALRHSSGEASRNSLGLLEALARRREIAQKTPEELDAIAARAAYERAKTGALGKPKPPKDTSFGDATELRKEFFSNQVAKDMQNVAVNFAKVKSASQDPSAAGDIAMIYGFMTGQDPSLMASA